MLRRTARQTARTIFFSLLVSPLTPAAAAELGDAIAAANRASVGQERPAGSREPFVLVGFGE